MIIAGGSHVDEACRVVSLVRSQSLLSALPPLVGVAVQKPVRMEAEFRRLTILLS